MPATATLIPDETQQHMLALERANHVRLTRAALKRAVSCGQLDVWEVVENCPWEAAGMAVMDLLLSQRRWGATRCRKLLSSVPLIESKTLGSLTDRQRQRLLEMLRLSAPRTCRSVVQDPGATPVLAGHTIVAG